MVLRDKHRNSAAQNPGCLPSWERPSHADQALGLPLNTPGDRALMKALPGRLPRSSSPAHGLALLTQPPAPHTASPPPGKGLL